jgi:hypothetical protein
VTEETSSPKSNTKAADSMETIEPANFDSADTMPCILATDGRPLAREARAFVSPEESGAKSKILAFLNVGRSNTKTKPRITVAQGPNLNDEDPTELSIQSYPATNASEKFQMLGSMGTND